MMVVHRNKQLKSVIEKTDKTVKKRRFRKKYVTPKLSQRHCRGLFRHRRQKNYCVIGHECLTNPLKVR